VEQKQEKQKQKQKQKQEIEECRQGLCSNLEGWPDIEKTFLVKDKKNGLPFYTVVENLGGGR
jgi:hypothetical protein